MAEAECKRLYGSQKKANMAEGIVVNVDQNITKKRCKQLYIIYNYKKPDGTVKSARLHITSVVKGTFLVPFPDPVNLPATAPILTATTTSIIPDNPSTSVLADPYNNVDPAVI